MMKKLFLPFAVIAVSFLSFGCQSDTIDALNPVVQTAKMQNAAKQAVDNVNQMQEYQKQLEKQQLQNYNIEE